MPKYYVVWHGVEPGIYDTWEDAELQIKGFPGARFKSYPTREAALRAYRGDPAEQAALLGSIVRNTTPGVNYDAYPDIIQDAIAVDAACSGNPGPVEYRGVHVRTGRDIFRIGPLPGGTNNIGEYLALVHALALCEKAGRPEVTIYSDSATALSWLRRGHSRTTLQPTPANERIRELLRRADAWRASHPMPRNPVVKWDTDRWGEIPADFGRK